MRFAICTSVYEEARTYFSDWISCAISASDGYDTEVIIALDGVKDTDDALQNLACSLPVSYATPATDANIAQVREAMLLRAIRSKADILIFCDIDDRLKSNAFSLHAAALKDADFSYGDMQPIDQNGSILESSFFSDAAVPKRISRTESIIDRNWLGFSNSAIWRKKIPSLIDNVPQTIAAVDWWFFTVLLKSGLKGLRVDGIVSDYRIHENNQLGFRPTATIESAKKRLHIMKKHYEEFPLDIIAQQRLSRIINLISKLDKNPTEMQKLIKPACVNARLWYEDIANLAIGPASANVTAVQLPHYAEPNKFTTRPQLALALAKIGVKKGDILMVHVSTKSLGFIIGGLRTILDALYDAIGNGTLMMPAFTGDLTDPATWFKPPVNEKYWKTIRESLPAFDAKLTPTKDIGALAELFRNEPGTERSNHPVSSFAARGPAASQLLKTHDINSRFGEKSPLQALCDFGGKVLLIGAPYESMTLLHLSSDKIDDGSLVNQSSPMLINGKKRWVDYHDRSLSWQWFPGAVENLVENNIAHLGTICDSRTIIVDAAEAINATCSWRKKNKC